MSAGFESFRQRVFEFLGVEDVSICWEVIFDIVEGGDENYEFGFEHLRLTADLLMAAILLSVFHDKYIMILEPTAYYSAQAVQMFRRWNLPAPKLQISNVGGCDISDHVEVVFHHGRRFDVSPSVSQRCRHVVQLFEDENVPQDSRCLKSLYEAALYE